MLWLSHCDHVLLTVHDRRMRRGCYYPGAAAIARRSATKANGYAR
jgi:hypothetical protein